MKGKKAQSILEYSILLGLVASALFLVQSYIQGAIKQTIRISANRLGDEKSGLVFYDAAKGNFLSDVGIYLLDSNSTINRREDGKKREYSFKGDSKSEEYIFSPLRKQSKNKYYDIENIDLLKNSGIWKLKEYEE